MSLGRCVWTFKNIIKSSTTPEAERISGEGESRGLEEIASGFFQPEMEECGDTSPMRGSSLLALRSEVAGFTYNAPAANGKEGASGLS